MGVAGVVLLVFRGTASLDTLGVLAAIGGALCMALGITLTKRWGRPADVGVLTFTGWQLTAGGLVLLPFWPALEGLPDTLTGSNVLGFAYLIIFGAVLSYLVWFRGIGRLPAVAVSFLALGSPVVATLLGYLVKDETLSALQIVGMAVVLAAIVLGQPRAPEPKAGETSPAPPDTTVSHVPDQPPPEQERSG
ncbi:probable blue pigment (indigoidine) exporter [Streptomyces sp. Termitarium-T10T-6]|nr:probable blue pigment (indigoidine) exporter [Streptomyces sp. Termitarium-T10T-6]